MILSAAILLGALCWGVAWADDDPWAEDRVIRSRSKANVQEPREVSAHGPHRDRQASEEGAELSADSAGAYFGLGDDFLLVGQDESGRATFTGSRNHGSDESSPRSEREVQRSTRERSSESHDEHSGHNHTGEGYSGENVYGPMWGVPDDAVGLDGYINPYPGMIDGVQPEQGGRHNREEAGSSDRNHADAEDGRSSDEIQRNHKINRGDPNDW